MSTSSTIEPGPGACCCAESPAREAGPGAGERVRAERRRRCAGQAAHEMRTPLAALRLELEEALIHRDTADPFAALTEMLRSVERLEHAVIALLWLLQREASGQTRGRHCGLEHREPGPTGL
ncbi:histidine kinase dimerization/phospho-acceptor domain-containing protein [Actinomadura syzygii]